MPVFLKFCSDIATEMAPFGFKPLQKGRKLKKVGDDRDIFFEIYFQSSTLNDAGYIKVLPHIAVYSKQLKKWCVTQTGNPHSNGLIFANHIGHVTPLKRWKEWNISGAGYDTAIRDLVALLKNHVLNIFDIFSNKADAINFLKCNGTQFNEWTEKSLSALDFMICFAEKSDAELFFNNFVAVCPYRKAIRQLFEKLSTVESIDLNYSEFVYANKVKLAFLNGLKIEH